MGESLFITVEHAYFFWLQCVYEERGVGCDKELCFCCCMYEFFCEDFQETRVQLVFRFFDSD